MEALHYLGEAVILIFEPGNLLVMLGGVLFGVIMGALPGISATMTVILAITFTYSMDPIFAVTFLCATHCSAVTGGSITAVLFSIPGTPASACTIFDGAPMRDRGEVGRALSLALYASAVGNLMGAIIMYFCTAPLMVAALKFGASEMAVIVLMGISILAFIDYRPGPSDRAGALHVSFRIPAGGHRSSALHDRHICRLRAAHGDIQARKNARHGRRTGKNHKADKL